MLLLGKLKACAIREDVFNLLASYVADRKQTCQVNGKQSDLTEQYPVESLRVRFWAHFSFGYIFRISQIA